MNRYPALIDGEKGAYGVSFPDLPGIVAMGTTLEEAMVNAEEALYDAAAEARADGTGLPAPSAPEDVSVAPGETLISVALITVTGRTVRANLNLDADVLAYIDGQARQRGLTRTAYVAYMARRMAQMGG